MGSHLAWLGTAILASCFLSGGCQMFSGGSLPTLGRLSPFNGLPAQSEPEIRDSDALEPPLGDEGGDHADVSALAPKGSSNGDDNMGRPGHRALPVTESVRAITEDQAAVPSTLPAG